MMEDTTKLQEVYIGSGVTKHVTIDENYCHYLDTGKLEKIINDNLGKKIVVGAKEDWFFTAQTVTAKDMEKIKLGDTHILLYSAWDQLIVKIKNNENETEQEINCTLNIEKYPAQLAFNAGYTYAMNRIQHWFNKKLYHECLRVWKYEVIKDFAKEVNALIDKYESIHQNVTKYPNHKERDNERL